MSQHFEASTIRHYNEHAEEFIADTVAVNMEPLYLPFLECIPQGGSILDAGCGSGRDTKAFQERGYEVTAIDASARMVEAASRLTSAPVRQMRFQEMDWDEEFDGVWACASVLHVPRSEIGDVLRRFVRALRPAGVAFLSFKRGDGERQVAGRHFTDFTKDVLTKYVLECPGLEMVRLWGSNDQRLGREGEEWVSVIARKVGEKQCQRSSMMPE